MSKLNIKDEIWHLIVLESKLKELNPKKYKSFRNKKLKKLYNFWGLYDFDSKEFPPDWDERKKKTLKRDNDACYDCDEDEKNLYIHHEIPRGANGIYDHRIKNL